MPAPEKQKQCETRAEIIKALAHPSRVLIAESLVDGEKCVRELTEIVGADMSTVSRHLSQMRQVGLVESEKRGLNHYFRVACPCLLDFFRCVDLIARTHSDEVSRGCA